MTEPKNDALAGIAVAVILWKKRGLVEGAAAIG
jgi:hypothetical protein